MHPSLPPPWSELFHELELAKELRTLLSLSRSLSLSLFDSVSLAPSLSLSLSRLPNRSIKHSHHKLCDKWRSRSTKCPTLNDRAVSISISNLDMTRAQKGPIIKPSQDNIINCPSIQQVESIVSHLRFQEQENFLRFIQTDARLPSLEEAGVRPEMPRNASLGRLQSRPFVSWFDYFGVVSSSISCPASGSESPCPSPCSPSGGTYEDLLAGSI